MEEIYDAFEVEFWAEQVEEDILAVALVELRNDVLHLVLHGEGTRSVREARHHLPNRRLQGQHLLLQILILLLQ